MEPKTIIVPDVHGRAFWKDAADYDCDIVFLGDYLDPYATEEITKRDAIENFKEILDFADKRENVHLLLGNHDAGYAMGKSVCTSRMDWENYNEIAALFEDYRDRFRICYSTETNGTRLVLSHAGFHPWWVELCGNKYTPDTINDNMWTNKAKMFLGYVSMWRGGFTVAGSPIWADIREFKDTDLSGLGYKQIVGHTMLNEKPIGNDCIMCLDLKRIFILDDEGVIREKDGEPIDFFTI